MEGNLINKVPFSVLLKFQLDSCHHELYNILKDQGGSEKQNRRKQILEFLILYRKRFLKLLVLYRIPVADTIVKVHELIDTQDRQIEQCANELFNIHNQLKPAQLPPHDLRTAIDVLGTGTYRRLPLSLKNRFVPINPSSPEETRLILNDLENIIRVRLLCHEVLPIPFKKSMIIDTGCVTFTVPEEFSVKLTLYLGETANIWKLMNIRVLCSSPVDADYEGMNEIHPIHIAAIMERVQDYFNKSVDRRDTIQYLYDELHVICMKYQLEMLASQADYLARTRWADLKITKPLPSLLSLSFWNSSTFQRDAQFILNISSEIKSNESMAFTVAIPLKKDLSDLDGLTMSGLDVERLLSSVTERVACNITNWWHEELIALGFQANVISSTFNHNGLQATLMSLEVEITPSFSVQITLNPRTGFVSVSMAHLIQVDSEGEMNMIISQGISRAQTLLNTDYNKIADSLYKVALSICLQSIYSLSIQVGFKVLERSSTENALTSSIGDNLHFIIESAGLDVVKICFSVDDGVQTGSYTDVSCKGWLFLQEKSMVLEIKPSDIQQSMDAFGTGTERKKWKDLTETDLQDIHRFALQYQIFARLKRTLDMPFLRYHYIVPKSLDLQELSINRVMCRNPPLCLRLIRPADSYQNLVNDNLYYSASAFNNAIFLNVESSRIVDFSSAASVTYVSQIRLPPLLLPRVLYQDGITNGGVDLNRDTGIISCKYKSDEELSGLFLENSMIALHLIDFATRLQQMDVVFEKLSIHWEIVPFRVIRFYITPDLTVDFTFVKSRSMAKQVEWTAQYANNQVFDLVLSPDNLVTYPWEETQFAAVAKHAIVVSRFLLRIEELSQSLKRLYNFDLSIVKISPFEFLMLLKVGGSLNFGLFVSFFDETISVRDACSIVEDEKNYSLNQLSLFYDFSDTSKETTTTVQGLFSYLPAVLGGYSYVDRVVVPTELYISLARELETYLEAVAAYYFLYEILKKPQDIQHMKAVHDRLSIHIVLNQKDRFLFFFSTGSGIVARYTMPDKKQTRIKEFQKLATVIFDQAKLIEPKDRMTSTWCLMMLEMANVPESILSDLYKLFSSVLFKTEKSPGLLLLVPPEAGPKFPPCGSNALIIDKTHIKLLIQFKEGDDTLLLPIKYDLESGHLNWWTENPIAQGALQQFEKQVFEGSKNPSSFPGLHKAISSLVGVPLAKIRK